MLLAILAFILEVGTIMTSILQGRKLKLTQMVWPGQGLGMAKGK